MINDMSPDVSSDVTSDNKMTRFYATVSDIELLDPLEGHNEGSVGQLNFSYAWDTTQIPASLGSRIYTALIAGWNQDGFTDEDILSGASTWEDIWKNGEAFGRITHIVGMHFQFGRTILEQHNRFCYTP